MILSEALIYGIIQGITEFLPISSSGHLLLFPWLMGWEDPGLSFSVALHWGTLFGVGFYYRRDLWTIVKSLVHGSLGGPKNSDFDLGLKIGVATVPAALMGFLLDDLAETVFRSPWITATSLIVVALALAWADKKKGNSKTLADLTWTSALLIGVAQGIALIPGVSRSGITMCAALFLGMGRSAAVRFSFLLSVPIILGAGLLKAPFFLDQMSNGALWVGLVSAGLSGYAAIFFLVRFVQTHTFLPFVLYRIILGLTILILLL